MKEGRDRIDKHLRWRPILAFFCMLLVAAALSPVVAYASEDGANTPGEQGGGQETPAPTVVETPDPTPAPATDPQPEVGYSDVPSGGNSDVTDLGGGSNEGSDDGQSPAGNEEGGSQELDTTGPSDQGDPAEGGEGNDNNAPTTDPDPNANPDAGNADGTEVVTDPSDQTPSQGTDDPNKKDEETAPQDPQPTTPKSEEAAGANNTNSTNNTPAPVTAATSTNVATALAANTAATTNEPANTANTTTQGDNAANQSTAQDSVTIVQEVKANNDIDQDALYQSLVKSIGAEAGQSMRPVDMVFVIDATGSMSSDISKVRSILSTLVQRLKDEYLIDLWMAITEYRDVLDKESNAAVVHTYYEGGFSYWSTSTDVIKTDLNSIRVSDGGDGPETPTYGIGSFLDRAGFRSYSDRFVFLLTDASYKEGGAAPTMAATIDRLRAANIHAIVVSYERCEPTYRRLYEDTGGAFININTSASSFTTTVAETIIGLTKKSYEVDYSDIDFADVIYTGSYLEPSLTVILSGKTLREGTDYTVTWGDNVNAGSTAYAIIRGIGLYEGSKTAHFVITPADIAKCAMAINSVTYSGSARTPLLARATYRGMNLVRGTDYYIVSYSSNVNAGTGYATIRGKGNYRGTAIVPFVINPAPLSWATAVMPDVTYNGHERTPKPTHVTWNDMTLVHGRDYTIVDYFRNVNANDGAYVVLEGLGNYAGRKTADFLIRPAQISWATFHMPTPTYSGRALTPNPSKVTWNDQTLKQDRDFTVLDYYRNVNVGEGAYAVIEGTGNYTGRTTAPFDINPRHISVVQFEMPDVVYSGEARTPVPVSTHWYGNSIKRGRDYTMTAYYRNVNANDGAYAVIDGRGNYTGRTTVSFWIQPAHIDWADIGMHDVNYNGKARTPSTAWAEWNGMNLKKGRDYIIKAYYHNVNASEDEAYAVIEGKGNYKGRTTAYFEIRPARIPWATIVMPTRTYNGSAQTPAPTKVTWNGMTLTAGRDFRVVKHYRNVNANDGAYVVIDGIGNYAGRTTQTFKINPANIKNVSFYIPGVGYNGKPRTPAPSYAYFNGSYLERGKDYTMSGYYHNVQANDNAYAVIDGRGNFTGRTTVSFIVSDLGGDWHTWSEESVSVTSQSEPVSLPAQNSVTIMLGQSESNNNAQYAPVGSSGVASDDKTKFTDPKNALVSA